MEESRGVVLESGGYCFTCEPGFCETDTVLFDGVKVEVFGLRIEEGHCRGVDAMAQGRQRFCCCAIGSGAVGTG